MRANLIGGGIRGSLECKKMLKECHKRNKRMKREEAALKLLRWVRACKFDWRWRNDLGIQQESEWRKTDRSRKEEGKGGTDWWLTSNEEEEEDWRKRRKKRGKPTPKKKGKKRKKLGNFSEREVSKSAKRKKWKGPEEEEEIERLGSDNNKQRGGWLYDRGSEDKPDDDRRREHSWGLLLDLSLLAECPAAVTAQYLHVASSWSPPRWPLHLTYQPFSPSHKVTRPGLVLGVLYIWAHLDFEVGLNFSPTLQSGP